MNTETVGFKTNDDYLGDAFSGLKHKTVFVALSAVYGDAEISVEYIKGCHTNPLPLQDLSRLVIRYRVQFAEQLALLPIASTLKKIIADK